MATSPILIVHAPDAVMEASIICHFLKEVGYFALTYNDAVGGSDEGEVRDHMETLLTYVPAFIFLASPGLLADTFLSGMAHDAISVKKFIAVSYGFEHPYPRWFSANLISLTPSTQNISRQWNRLADILTKFIGFSFLEE